MDHDTNARGGPLYTPPYLILQSTITDPETVEWIGYIGRAVSANQTPNWTQGAYIVQVLFILIAPALFAATIYMELGRIIALCDGAHHSLIKLRWLTKIFVAGDVLSFLMQAGGEHDMDPSTSIVYLTSE